MEKNISIKILNIISGSRDGGAEKFFERLSVSFENYRVFKQKVVIRKNMERYNFLRKYIKNLDQINFFHFLNPFYYKKMNRIYFNFKPDIVFSWMNRASSLLPKKKINKEINVGRLGGYYKIKNYLKCDYLIANTEDIKNYICKQGWDPEKVVHIPNFVNENNNSRINNSKKEKIILCLGRFHSNKGIDIIIRAMTKLPNFRLWIVGSGNLKNSYLNLIKKLGIVEKVKIFKWTDNISQYLNIGEILVCPSRHEPFGNIVVDGWAHKIPIVASDIGGPSEMIKNKINGIKFQSENIDQLVKSIKTISRDKKLKKELTQNGYKEFKKKFSKDIVINKYIKFFKEISRKCVV